MSSTPNQSGHNTLRKYYRRYIWYFLGGIIVLAGANIFLGMSPWLLREAIDSLENPSLPSLAPTDAYYGMQHAMAQTATGVLPWFALAIVGVTLIAGIFRFFARRTIIWASRDIEFELRNEVFNHLLKLSSQFYQRTPTGDIIARLSNDIESVRLMVGPAVMQLINTVMVSIVAFYYMIKISPTLTLYALIPLPLLTIAMWQIGQQTHRRFMKIQDHFSTLSTFVQESMAGIRVIKAYRREKYQQGKFEVVNREYVRLNLDLVKVRALLMPTVIFLVRIVVLIVILVGGADVIKGNITKGEYVAFMAYLLMLVWPMLAVGWVISLYQRGKASLARLDDLLREIPDIQSPENPQRLPQVAGALRFSGLSFTYPGSNVQVLRDINFEVKPGETLAIVGATGSGKSTLISLLMRTYTIPDGTIRIDETDINRMALDDLRGMIGFVRQDSYLFSDTIAANIALSQPKIDMDAVHEAAQVAAFESEVDSFPHKYDTILGERGITLSGGQKQRAAIARALLKQPRILILDDAFSSVDTQTEEMILERLKASRGNITTLLISHRPSTIRRADRIIVLDGGTIVERGTHDELIAGQGRYYEIIRRELLSSELEALE